jgi:hypothetical protein
MTRIPKSVRHLLKSKPVLKQLELEIAAQKALLLDVQRHLPDELRPHCLAAQLRNGQLLLHTDSPVWAMRLRYGAPQLLILLQKSQQNLNAIKVKVIIPRQSHAATKHPARHSDIAADIVRSSADDIEQTPLREAMIRLSKTLRR